MPQMTFPDLLPSTLCQPTGFWREREPKPSILLIEDDELLSTALGRSLRRSGFQVSIGHDGETGVELAIREAPDLIVLDLGLPGLSGFNVVRVLRSVPITNEIPILVLTGDLNPAIETRAAEWDPIRGVLRKPTPGRVLARKIASVLGVELD